MTQQTNHHAAVEAIAEATPLGVSVVVPMYNERECAERLVKSLDELAAAHADRFEFEFLLVDDGSVDETVALLQSATLGARGFKIVRHETNRGIAAAILTGARSARYEVIVSMDCDGSYDPALMIAMIDRLQAGADLVTASPYHVSGSVENVPLWRLRLSRLASQLYGLACRERLSCYTSCFRAYRRSSILAVELENEGFVGVAELLWKVLDRGGRVAEQPARLRARVAGRSKMRVVRAGMGHLRLMGGIVRQRAAGRLRRRGEARPRPEAQPARCVDRRY